LVLEAAKALEAANATGDAQAIRAAMAALEAALHGQAQAQADVAAAGAKEVEAKAVVQDSKSGESLESNEAVDHVDTAQAATESIASEAPEGADGVADAAAQAPVVPAKAPRKPVIAMRGDDRPGMKKEVPVVAGKWGDRKDAGRGGRDDKPGFSPRGGDRPPRGDDRFGSADRGRSAPWQEAPRLGDTAFRAQRDALEHAQHALRTLAAQAHGEALTQLLTAWEKRDANLVPTAQDLGARATPATRAAWVQALGGESKVPVKAATKPVDPKTALLRLEMAAEVPTPAEHLSARRGLQLQLLTRRNDPAPDQTWGQDAAAVFAGAFDAQDARRVQTVLKALLKR
jgi:hypothetical protein